MDQKMWNYLDHFLEMIAVEKSASKNTIEAYRRDVRDYLSYIHRNGIALSEDNAKHFEAYIKEELSDLSEHSLSRKISSARQFYQFLVFEKVVENNPLLHIKFPRKRALLPKSLSNCQLDKLFDVLAKDESDYGIRLRCIVELLYSTGLRISELITLKISDFGRYLDNAETLCEHLIIKGKGGKERVIILNASAMRSLERYLEIRSNFIPKSKLKETVWLFPSRARDGGMIHISRQRVGQMFKKAAIGANIDPALISPHKIRHTFASHMIQNGANIRFVQEMLGHSDISSTQIYTKVLTSQAKELVLENHPIVLGE